MKTKYGQGSSNFPLPDWPNDITLEKLSPWYDRAEAELGVSADEDEQSISRHQIFQGLRLPDAEDSAFDCSIKRIGEALAQVDAMTRPGFSEWDKPVTEIKVRSLPAARNSQPYRNRRACAGNTNCIPICPIQAKYDPTITLERRDQHRLRETDRTATVASEIVVGENGRRQPDQLHQIQERGRTEDRRRAASRPGSTLSPRMPSRHHGCC